MPSVRCASSAIGSATSTLAASGFKWKISYENVSDPNLDGTVLTQSPDANTQAKPGTVINLTVGRANAAATTTTTTDTTTIP